MPIQNLPAFWDMQYCNKEDGKLAPDGYLYNDQTFQALNAAVILLNYITTTVISQGNVTVNGLTPPSLTTDQINALVAAVAPDPVIPIGTIWYNSTISKLQFLSATGVVSTITSTP